MYKMSPQRRLSAVILACIMLITFIVPASAMGFDDLETVVDATDNSSSSVPEQSQPPDPDTSDPAGHEPPGIPDDGSSSSDASESGLEDETATPTNAGDPPLGASGEEFTPLPDDSGVITFGNPLARASVGPNNIYYDADWSITHVWPFSGGTQKYPIYKFRTADGDTAYCIESYKFNSYTGHPVTGQLTYPGLSATKQNQIAKAAAANTSGTSNTRMYAAAQCIVWEIAAGQSHRSGSIYKAVITANGLSSEYEAIMSAMNSLAGEVPSFMSTDKSNPQIHQMTESGGSWSITLSNSNSKVTLDKNDFKSLAAMNFSVSGNSLTVTSSQEPGSDSFVEWAAGESGGGGVIFWCNDTVQDKVTVNVVPGAGYMAFSPESVPPPEDEEPEPKIGYLHIHKYNGVDNEPLSGAIFRVECEGFLDEAFHVDGGSTIVIPIPEGADSVEVSVTEVQAPSGFVGSGETKVVTVYPHDVVNLTEVSFVNYPEPSSLTIYKHEKGREDVPLGGARFRLSYVDPNVSSQEWEFTTDANGKWTIDPLPAAGSLRLEELESADGYVMGTQTVWIIPVAVGEHKIFSVSNDKKAELLVYKRDSVDGSLLDGAVIKATLLRSHTEPYESGTVYTETTQNGGVAHFKNMIPGEYRIEEQSPPPFYLGTDKVFTVSVYDGSVETVSVTFENDRYSGLTLVKLCSVTANPLEGAVWSLYKGTEAHPTDFLGDFRSNKNGMVVIQNLPSNQWYTAIEKQPPFGFELSEENVKTVYLKAEDLEQNITLIYRNPPKPKLLICKESEDGTRLPGAIFRVSKEDSSEYVEVVSDENGECLLENLEATWYTIVEIRSPTGMVLDSTPHKTVTLEVGKITPIRIVNKKLPQLRLRKIDEQSGLGIEGITLRITKEGATEFEDVITGKNGIVERNLEPGHYQITEINAPGYVLTDEVFHIELKAGSDAELVIKNRKKPTLKLTKLCSVTKQPLKATFQFQVKNGPDLGTYTTDPETGELLLDDLEYYNDPLVLEITEVRGPDHYLITEEKREVTIRWGENKAIEWENTPENPILIYKRDRDGNPVPNTEFLVTTVNGTHVGSYKSGVNGIAVVPGQQPGFYLVRETRVANENFILDSEPQLVELRYGAPATVEFINDKRPQLEILKLSKGDIPTPLQGVLMRVERLTGELIGDFRTDHEGKIHLQADPGFVRIFELETIPGFTLDSTPQIKELKANTVTTCTFYNQSIPGFMLQKICSVNKTPLSSVKYTITRLDGSAIGTFETDELGIIYLELDEEWIVVTEISTVDGYRLSSSPRTIKLTPNQLHIEKWENTPFPIFELEKYDAKTKQPLASVKFKLFDQYMREVGVYTTNQLGRIVLTGMSEGKFFVQECETSGPEYILDKTVHEIRLSYGQTTKLVLYNHKMGNVRIRKVCSETGRALSGATYLIYDAQNNILGEFTSNVHGIIELENVEPQKLKLREIKAPPNFVLDENTYELVVTEGAVAELLLKNTPEKGRIQIIKIATEASTINKVKKGDGLQGAVFEVFDEELELVDTIKTDKRGIGMSDYLPLGRYVLKEVKSPDFFYTDGKPFYADIRKHDDLIRFTVENHPEDIEVSVEKRGVLECLPGDLINYEFSEISNKSNCSLDEFYWADTLPTDAVRIESLNTGTWNQRVRYDVYIKTNLKSTWKRIETGLHSSSDHTIDLRSSALRLAANEYVVSFKLVFGEVDAGFKEDTAPFITCRVLDTLPDGYRFVNRTEVGGKRGKEEVFDKDTWVTVTFRGKRCLPKTGF